MAGKLGEAAGYWRRWPGYRVPYRVGHAVVAAHASRRGSDAVSGVDIARLDRQGRIVPLSVRRVACDAVAVGYGFTANLELALTLGCLPGSPPMAAWPCGPDRGERPRWTVSTRPVRSPGSGGATLAVVEGQLAGAAAAESAAAAAALRVPAAVPGAAALPAAVAGSGAETGVVGGRALSARDIAKLLRRRHRLRAFAEVMASAHAAPAGWTTWPRERTLICRCEEVTHTAVVAAVTERGATDARTVKLLTRAGMGWCQGRECGYATAELTARLCGRPCTREDLLAFAHRPLAIPVALGALAAIPADPST